MKPSHLTAIALLTIALPISAGAVSLGDNLGTDAAQIRTSLESQGFKVKEIEVEHREIEVEATRNGAEHEFTIAADTGLVIEVESENRARDN